VNPTRLRVLVTGAAGMLGTDLVPVLAEAHDVTPADFAEFDVTDASACDAFILGAHPDVVVHAAAFTHVDRCETEKDLAFRINATGAGNVARAAKRADAWLVQVSTDYVFDGRKETPYVEGDRPLPLSVYGKSKWLGEIEVTREMGEGGFAILRTSWLFGPGGPNFVETILRLAAEREFLAVVDDQKGCPTYTADLAHAVGAVIESGARGLFHAAGAGSVTWRGFAIEVLRRAGIDKEVRPLTTAELNRPAPRPANSVLSTEKLRRATGYVFRDWREALADYFARRA
jgi:dTDP-4-dehydrorhamnose reductase